MYASKENARRALAIAQKVLNCEDTSTDDNQFVVDFLDKAISKLPTEKAFKADKKRGSKKAQLTSR